MSTPEFFRSRLDTMIDMRHPLVVLAARLPWQPIEQALAPKFAHQDQPAKQLSSADLLGQREVQFGGGVSNAGRPRLSIRLMASLLYLKNSFNLSDEELVQRWSENVYFQFFSGLEYFEPRLPCDATQIGRFRRAIGEEGLEQLLKATIETAVQIGGVKPAELERVIVDTTVQEKAIAHPVDSRLLEIARHKVVSAAKRAGIALKQTFAKEGKVLRRKAGGYAHAKQFRRLKRTVKRQRTILGVVMREVQRKLDADRQSIAAGGAPTSEPSSPKAMRELVMWLERAERIRTQQIMHRGKFKSLSGLERRWLKRRQAIEPAIGHANADNRMDRCWLHGALGDALHALSCAAGYNIRWLLRAIVRLAAKRHLFALPKLALYARISVMWPANALRRPFEIVVAAFARHANFDERASAPAVQVN